MLLTTLRQFTEIFAINRNNRACFVLGEFPDFVIRSAQQPAIPHMNGVDLTFPQCTHDTRRCVLIEKKYCQQNQLPPYAAGGLPSGELSSKAGRNRYHL